MGYFQITEEDYNSLKQKLEEVLGEGYEVETHKEVSALMGALRDFLSWRCYLWNRV